MQMRETARASILSLPNQGLRDKGEIPDAFHKTSGVRYVTDNASSEFAAEYPRPF